MKNHFRRGGRELFYHFLKCGLAGWCLEILFTSVESILAGDFRLMGKTSLFMFPIYGLGALLGPICGFLDGWLESGMEGLGIVKGRDLLLRHGMLDMVLIFTAEYLFGALLTRYGICPWDYSEKRMNIHGLIRLDFAPLWFLTGLLFELLCGDDRIKRILKRQNQTAGEAVRHLNWGRKV